MPAVSTGANSARGLKLLDPGQLFPSLTWSAYLLWDTCRAAVLLLALLLCGVATSRCSIHLWTFLAWLGLKWLFLYFFLMLWCLQRCSAEAGPGFPDGCGYLLSHTIWLSAPASHTCSPSYHQLKFKHSGLLSTCCQTVFDSTTCGGLSQSPCSTSHPATQRLAPLPPAPTAPRTFRASFHQRLLSRHNWRCGEPSHHSSWLTAYSLHRCLLYLCSTCVSSFVSTEPLLTLLWALQLHLLPQLNQRLPPLHSTWVWWMNSFKPFPSLVVCLWVLLRRPKKHHRTIGPQWTQQTSQTNYSSWSRICYESQLCKTRKFCNFFC